MHFDRVGRGRAARVALAVLVLGLTAVPAFASNKGSKSESATAAWLADGSSFACDGQKPTYPGEGSISKDNEISGDLYVWILSSSAVDPESITWWARTGSDDAQWYGDLDWTNQSCGQYKLMAVDLGANSDYEDDGGYMNYYLLSGSWSFKFDYAGKNYSADSARF